MTSSRKFLALTLGLVALPGCSDRDVAGVRDAPSGAGGGPGSAQMTGASVPDLGGFWTWSNVEVLSFPPFVAAFLGIVPEGPEGHNTHARCESAGTMTLVQTGRSFEGTAIKTFNSCETKGGQPFQQPGVLFPITDGRITGAAVQFSMRSPTVQPCPHHAVVTALENGVAVALSGTGRCILPDHPKSESPFPLDPTADKGGLSKTLSWEAARP